MKSPTLLFLLFICIIFSNNTISQSVKTYDPLIQNIVDSVNGDTIWNDIASLAVLQRLTTNVNTIQ